MKNLFLTLIFCSLFIGNLFCQNEKERNWSVEIGFGITEFQTETYFKDADTTFYGTFGNSALTPTLRLSRKFQLSKNEKFSIQPFVGFTILGTNNNAREEISRFKMDTTVYFVMEDGGSYHIPSLEVGTFFNYTNGKLSFQLGIKSQYHLTVYGSYPLDYSPNRIRINPHVSPDSNDLKYEKEPLSNFSANAGLRVQYDFNQFLIAAEGWYGLTNLSVSEADWYENEIHENNIRLMFGYRF